MSRCRAGERHPKVDLVLEAVMAHIKLHGLTMCPICQEQMLYSLIQQLALSYGQLIQGMATELQAAESRAAQ